MSIKTIHNVCKLASVTYVSNKISKLRLNDS